MRGGTLAGLMALAALVLAGSTAAALELGASDTNEGSDVDALQAGPGPDYPGATFIPAAASCFRAHDGRREVHRIVIHITDGAGNARATAEYFAGGAEGRQVSAHYVVGQGGEIFQCVRERDIAYHAHAANADSIGIENSARTPGERGPDDPGLPVTDDNYRSTAALVATLCDRYGLPRDRTAIMGHNEADKGTTHTNCPTGAWDWDVFMAALDAA